MKMTAPGRLVPVAALLAVAILFGAATEAAAQVRGRSRIAGRVTDVAGNPIANATVVLTHLESGGTLETTTDEEGRFQVGNMGRGEWNVDVTAVGYLPAAMSARLSEEQRMRDVQIQLTPGEAGGGGTAVAFGPELSAAISAANAFYTAGDFVTATREFEAILGLFTVETEPNLPMVNINVGNSAYEAGDYAKAHAAFAAALAAFPDATDARLGLAKSALMERDIDAAMTEMQKIDPAEIQDANVFYNFGSLLFDQGRIADAVTYFELALQRNPRFADAHLQLGICMVAERKPDQARPHFERVIELDPGSANAALAQDFLNSLQ